MQAMHICQREFIAAGDARRAPTSYRAGSNVQ
jgi:hypothetical protein